MTRISPVRFRRFGPLCAAAVVALLAATACGDSGSGGGGGGDGKLPAELQVVSIRELTGAAAFAAESANKGMELALDQINSQKFLGDTKVTMKTFDTNYNAQTAASQVTSAIADKNVAAIFGPLSSLGAQATAPIAQRAKMPIIFTQAGSSGVLVGDYTFRATPPLDSYWEAALKDLPKKNAKTVAVLYNSEVPSFSQLATKDFPGKGSTYGYSVVSTVATTGSTVDFTAPASKTAGAKPDAVLTLFSGATNATVATALRQAGFTGPLYGMDSACCGALTPAGKDGANFSWPTNFNAVAPQGKAAQDFVSAYKAKFGEDPRSYAAEAYDSAWWLARAIKKSGSGSRTGIAEGLRTIATEGFDGAQGPLTFEANDIRVPGILITWDGKQQSLASGS